MKTSKKIFLLLALLFFSAIAYLGYDISSRTTFPGPKSQPKEESIKSKTDTTQMDSLKNKSKDNF